MSTGLYLSGAEICKQLASAVEISMRLLRGGAYRIEYLDEVRFGPDAAWAKLYYMTGEGTVGVSVDFDSKTGLAYNPEIL